MLREAIRPQSPGPDSGRRLRVCPPGEDPVKWRIRVCGPLALWGGVRTGPECFSMLIPSASAVEGKFRSVLGKKELRWVPTSVSLLRMPGSKEIMCNERKDLAHRHMQLRTQTNHVFLTDVDYILEAYVTVNHRLAGEDDTVAKFNSMMARRIREGYRHYQPYLGRREGTAYITEAGTEIVLSGTGEILIQDAPEPKPIPLTLDLGFVFYGRDYDGEPEMGDNATHYLAPMKILNGVAKYPTWDEVRRFGKPYTAREARRFR
jgi:hypothetical protein